MQNNYLNSPEFWDSVLKNLPIGVLVIDLEGNVLMCNNQAYKNLGIPSKSGVPAPFNLPDFLESMPAWGKVLKSQLKKQEKPFDLYPLLIRGKHIRFKGNPFANGTIIIAEDITRRKKREQSNLKAVLEGQENERRRLAREIHDGIGPVMSIIKLHLDAVKSELVEAPEKTLNKINTMSELIHQVSDNIREISHDLMPSALKDLGLVAALENLCLKTNESKKMHVRFYTTGMTENLDNQIALSIFRIAQELLNNAIKYAKANNINIQLIRHPKSVLLMVEDDGIGFDKSELSQILEKGIGIRNIQTRTAALGGRLNYDTQNGRGVLATVEIPLTT